MYHGAKNLTNVGAWATKSSNVSVVNEITSPEGLYSARGVWIIKVSSAGMTSAAFSSCSGVGEDDEGSPVGSARIERKFTRISKSRSSKVSTNSPFRYRFI